MPRDTKGLAERARAGFARFWNAEKQFCFDVIDAPGSPDGKDAALRPNQIFAVSLPETALTPEQQRAVVDVCARELLTSFGLRSLARNEPVIEGATREALKNATQPTIRARCGDGFSAHSRWLTCACTEMPRKRCLFWSRCLAKSRPPGSARPAKFLTAIRHSRRTAASRKHGRSGKLCGPGEPSAAAEVNARAICR